MKKIIVVLTLILAGTNVFAQRSSTPEFNIHSRMIDLDEKARAFGLTEAQYEAVIDQAYANPQFTLSQIYLDNKVMKENTLARYNASEDEIEIKNNANDTQFSALAKDPNISVKIGLETYVLVPLKGSNADGGYFNVLYKGENYDLYKKVTARFVEPKPAATSYSQPTKPSFAKNTTYYMVENGSFYELPTGKSKILSVFNKKKNEIKSFVKKNKLDVKKEKDLAKVVEEFDRLNK